tara:strand:- start:69 stop:530 length:462 start_codon:yes stop_codon:yes gene_type:complete
MKAIKQVRTIVKDVRDAKKKLSPHQDPRSKASAAMRFAFDNRKKSKSGPSPHTNGSTKKRTLKESLKPGTKKGKDTGPTGSNRIKKKLGGPAGSQLGDLNKDGKMSGYEKKRQTAIEKAMQKRGKMQKPMTKKLYKKGPAGKPIANTKRGKTT